MKIEAWPEIARARFVTEADAETVAHEALHCLGPAYWHWHSS
jgi:hypothetical protein